MITYPYGAFGFQILFRLRGSAVFKSLLPALISSGIYVLLYETLDFYNYDRESGEVGIMDHPYPMGALIAAFTYLLSFRANFAYNRYWEAFTSVHAMHSKWLDVGTDLAAFHLQAARYNDNKPPTFGENPHLTSLEREREFHEKTFQEIKDQIDDLHDNNMDLELMNSTSKFSKWRLLRRRRRRKEKKKQQQQQKALLLAQQQQQERKNQGQEQEPESGNNDDDDDDDAEDDNMMFHTTRSVNMDRQTLRQASAILHVAVKPTLKNINAPPPTASAKKRAKAAKKKGRHRRVVSSIPPNDGGAIGDHNDNQSSVMLDDEHYHRGGRGIEKRPLFLQEAAHLLSLLSAVAMSTLRNDLETAESPLIPFTPGSPFPCVDPDGITADIREDWESNPNRKFATARYFCGLNRSEKDRALYNAARPFRVIGGVSDNEILLLQAARGPQAKLNMVSFWVQEYISREHLAGSLGKVAPPILSRLYQYISDGCLHYNQARKIAYIPFPFPHAQITSIFVLVIVAMIPILMLTFVTSELIGFILNLFTVMCFAGLHEVARELENPFQNAPNDLPANNFHAQYNEALMSMFAGYHPDAYWVVKDSDETTSGGEETMLDSTNMIDSIGLGELVAGMQGSSDGQEVQRVTTANRSEGRGGGGETSTANAGAAINTTQQEATNVHETTYTPERKRVMDSAWLSAFRGSDTKLAATPETS